MRVRSELKGYLGRFLRGEKWETILPPPVKNKQGATISQPRLFASIEAARAAGATKCCPRFNRMR